MTSDLPTVQPGDFKVKVNESLKTSHEFMKGNLAKRSVQVLDSRPAEVYRGKPAGACREQAFGLRILMFTETYYVPLLLMNNLYSENYKICMCYIFYTDRKSGHYPGAVNIPFGANLLDKEHGTFKTKDQLKQSRRRSMWLQVIVLL